MIAYAHFDSTDGATTTSTTTWHNADDGTATTSASYILQPFYIYTHCRYVEMSLIPDPEKEEAACRWFRAAIYRQVFALNSLFTEQLHRLRIAIAFNVYGAVLCRRMMFPKSGFLARAGRRKRN